MLTMLVIVNPPSLTVALLVVAHADGESEEPSPYFRVAASIFWKE